MKWKEKLFLHIHHHFIYISWHGSTRFHECNYLEASTKDKSLFYVCSSTLHLLLKGTPGCFWLKIMIGDACCTADTPTECCPGTSADVEVSNSVLSLPEPDSRSCCRTTYALRTSGHSSQMLSLSIRSWKLLPFSIFSVERPRCVFWCRPSFSALNLLTCSNILSSQSWVSSTDTNRLALAFSRWLTSFCRVQLSQSLLHSLCCHLSRIHHWQWCRSGQRVNLRNRDHRHRNQSYRWLESCQKLLFP